MNEGHAALLTPGASRPKRGRRPAADGLAEARKQCVFTTHTPVAGRTGPLPLRSLHRHRAQLVPLDTVKDLAGPDELNMTRLALNLSDYSNAVAECATRKPHGRCFPATEIHAVTNGVHTLTWAHSAMASLFDSYLPKWRLDPKALTEIASVPHEDIWKASPQGQGANGRAGLRAHRHHA